MSEEIPLYISGLLHAGYIFARFEKRISELEKELKELKRLLKK